MSALSKGIVSGTRVMSREDVEHRSLQVASGLHDLGVGQGDRVAILTRNDISFLEVTYGTMRLGAYAVPINWHSKPEEVAYVIADSGAKVLVGHADILRPLLKEVPVSIPVLCIETPDEVCEAYGIAPAEAGLIDGTTSYADWVGAQQPYDGPVVPQPPSMIYTSGTTGRPKGVRRQAATADQYAASEAIRELVYGIKPGGRFLLPGPLYHAAPNSYGTRAGRLGDVLVLMPRFDAEGLLKLIEAERIDSVLLVPTMFVRLLKLPDEVRNRYDLSSLRHVIHGAAPCPEKVKRAMIDWWGPVIYEFYGGTEVGPVAYATSEDALRKPGTVGRVSPGTDIRILDDDGNALPAGEVGEIYSRIHDYPDFTYQNDPEKRCEVERDGLITGGDIGYFDEDGYLFLCDRKRDMVISGGVNIYPAEIEGVLQLIPGVHDCAVFGIPHEEFGETLMAVVEPEDGASLDPAGLQEALRPHLADYKVPRHIEIRTGLPREDSGKIFKRRLRDAYWEKTGRRI